MKTFLLSTLLASVLLVSSVYAQGTPSISGDEVCGSSSSTVCKPAHLKVVFGRLMTIVAAIGSVLLVVVIVGRLVASWYAYRKGDAGAIKRAGEQAFQSLIGFVIIISIFGGAFMLFLSYFGAQPWATQLLQLFSLDFIPHAYAAGEELLPNPLGSNSLYDIIMAAANVAMRFILYPAIVFMWIASGFQFINSQGNPEGLKKAKSWLLYAVLITVVSFSLQGFILAFKNTAQSAFNRAGTTSDTSSGGTIRSTDGTPDGRGIPEYGAPGSACEKDGRYGVFNTSGDCIISSRGGGGGDGGTVVVCAGLASEVQRDTCFDSQGKCDQIGSEVKRDACFEARASAAAGRTR